MPPMLHAHFLQILGEMGLSRWGAWYSCRQGVNMEVDMGNVENASAAMRTTKTVKSLPMPKVWASPSANSAGRYFPALFRIGSSTSTSLTAKPSRKGKPCSYRKVLPYSAW